MHDLQRLFLEAPVMMRLILFLIALCASSAADARAPWGARASGEFPAITEQTLATVTIEAQTTATLPVTFGQVFECGTTMKPSTNVANQQSEVLATCNDGSARLVQFTVRPLLTSGVPLDVEIYSTAESEGPDLTPMDIDAAGLTASVFLDMTTGTDVDFDLGDLDLTTPTKITAQGPEMIEAEYQWRGGDGPDILIQTFIRYYADGRANIVFRASNGRFMDFASVDRQYIPTVTIGGTTVWDNGAATYTHYRYTGWWVEGWIGGDPSVVHRPDTALMSASKMFPTYWRSNPESAYLDTFFSNYTPGSQGSFPTNMANAGFSDHIGVVPNWDGWVIGSGGDHRTVTASIENAKAILSYPIIFVNNLVDNYTIKPSDYPTWTLGGPGGVGLTQTATSSGLIFELAHHPAVANMAYAMTGHPAHYQTMRDATSMCYLFITSANGSGVNRRIDSQNRTRAWCVRSLSNVAAYARADDPIALDYKTYLDNNIGYQYDETLLPDQNDLGWSYLYVSSGSACAFTDAFDYCRTSKFMDYFWIMGLGQLDEMNVLADETELHGLMDNMFNIVLGQGGAGGTDEFCYNNAWEYSTVVSETNNKDTTTWFKDGAKTAWRQAYEKSCENAAQNCETPITSCSNSTTFDMSNPMERQPGNYLSALAYLLRYPNTETEAEEVLSRFKGLVEWPTVFASNPTKIVWAIGDPADFN